jgi:hypothetical protein
MSFFNNKKKHSEKIKILSKAKKSSILASNKNLVFSK